MKTFEVALAELLAQAVPLSSDIEQNVECLPLTQLQGRILAEEIVAPFDVPQFASSMMDGYAVRFDEIVAEPNSVFTVSQEIVAGLEALPLQAGTVARIYTGAPIPEGADTVVMQEWVEATEQGVRFIHMPEFYGQHIRQVAEDMSQGEGVIARGTRLHPQEIAVLATLGYAQAKVYRRLRIATFTTGDELLEPMVNQGVERGEKMPKTLPEAPAVGKIYNANRYLIQSFCQQCSYECIDLGAIADSLEAVKTALRQAATQADVILTTGGVSVGARDFIKTAVSELGQVTAWQVAMKPGKPLAMGEVLGTPFLGLPGNPVAAFSTFMLFARPYLALRQGQQSVQVQPDCLLAGFDYHNASNRTVFLRGRLQPQGACWQVKLVSEQATSQLSSLLETEGLIKVSPGEQVQRGGQVFFYRTL